MVRFLRRRLSSSQAGDALLALRRRQHEHQLERNSLEAREGFRIILRPAPRRVENLSGLIGVRVEIARHNDPVWRCSKSRDDQAGLARLHHDDEVRALDQRSIDQSRAMSRKIDAAFQRSCPRIGLQFSFANRVVVGVECERERCVCKTSIRRSPCRNRARFPTRAAHEVS